MKREVQSEDKEVPENPFKNKNKQTDIEQEDDYSPEDDVKRLLGKDSLEEVVDEQKSEITEFIESYQITINDIGLSPEQVYLRGDPKIDPNKEEEEIMEAMLFRDCYRKSHKLSSKTFVLRTVSGSCIMNMMSIISDYQEKGDLASSAIYERACYAARFLESFGEKSFKSKDFESKEELTRRVNFLLSLPTVVMDAVGLKTREFSNLTQAASNRALANF